MTVPAIFNCKMPRDPTLTMLLSLNAEIWLGLATEFGSEHEPPSATLLERHPGQPGHIAEEPRNQGKNAGGGKGDEASRKGQQDSQRQGTGRDGAARVRDHVLSPRTSLTSPLRVEAVTGPETRAAMRPCRSRTSVVGVVFALPRRANNERPPSSSSEG